MMMGGIVVVRGIVFVYKKHKNIWYMVIPFSY